jgi:2-oxoglutarate dehydrogenase E1 component
MTPKSLLRHKACVSDLSMMTGAEGFHRVLYEDNPPAKPQDVKRVIICSGKVYYDLAAARDKKGGGDVALVRLEQFYPFPDDALEAEIRKYPNAETVVWCQEEPENQGGWTFVDRRIEAVLKAAGCKAQRPVYAGRTAAAAPATGALKIHNAEQEALLEQALTI